MEDESSREDIANRITFRRHVSDINNLGRHKARSSTAYEQIFLFFRIGRKPEITNYKVIDSLLSKHDVLGLQITMDNSFLWKCFKGI